MSIKVKEQKYVVYPYNEIPLSDKKEWIFDTFNNSGEAQNNYAE